MLLIRFLNSKNACLTDIHCTIAHLLLYMVMGLRMNQMLENRADNLIVVRWTLTMKDNQAITELSH